MPQSLYTPFMANVGETLSRGMQQRQQNKLAQNAYMGDKEAMGQLMGFNPELGQKIQAGKRQEQQQKLRGAATQRKTTIENQDILLEIAKEAGMQPTAELGKAHADKRVAAFGGQLGNIPPFTDEAYERAKELTAPAGGMASAKTEIFKDGTVLTSLPDGTTQLTNPEGEIVTGDERLKVMKTAFDSEALLAGEKKAATQAITKSGEMFDKLEPITKSIANIDDAIAAIDEGADTGFIMSKLPSITQSSIKLDNVQKRMGLDVVGMTTFGALSKGELDMALDTAMPKTLDDKELRVWLVDKQNAQRKLANYLESVAMFLGTPGNTVADFIKLKKLQQKTKQTPGGAPELDSETQALVDQYGG